MQSLKARCFLPCLCLAALCISPAVQAQTAAQGHVFGSASLSDLRITLTDLNPDDGIAPALTWNDGVNTSFLGVWQNGRENGFPTYTSLFYDSQSTPGAWGDDKHVAFGGDTLTMNGNGLTATLDAPVSVEVQSWIAHSGNFTLTPFTAVTISAKVQVTAGVDVPPGVPAPPFYINDHYIESGFGGQLNLDLQGAASSTTSFGMPLTVDRAGPVSLSKSDGDLIFVTARNTGSTAATGSLYANASVWARSPDIPVPEPAAWAQMLLGLTLFAGMGVARRHRG